MIYPVFWFPDWMSVMQFFLLIQLNLHWCEWIYDLLQCNVIKYHVEWSNIMWSDLNPERGETYVNAAFRGRFSAAKNATVGTVNWRGNEGNMPEGRLMALWRIRTGTTVGWMFSRAFRIWLDTQKEHFQSSKLKTIHMPRRIRIIRYN